jgi:hypothetical protein
MYSKKVLASEFNISANTVTNTLKACGLDHKRDDFSEEEKAMFAQARELFAQGLSFKEVAKHFGTNVDEDSPKNRGSTRQGTEGQSTGDENVMNQALLSSILYDLDVRADVMLEAAFEILPDLIEVKMQEKAQLLLQAMNARSDLKAERAARNVTDFSEVVHDSDTEIPRGLGGSGSD